VKVVHVHRIAGIGGSERHLLTLLPALTERGVKVGFVGLDDTDAAPEPFYAELEASNIPFERFPCRRDVNPLLPFRVTRAIFAFSADLVHTHLVHGDVYGAFVPGTPLVSTKHNDDPFRATLPFQRVEHLLGRRASRIIVISDALRRFTVERVGLPAEKVEVVRYGLDELPPPWGGNPELGLPKDARVLLCVGRLSKQKGIDMAITALPAIRAEHPDAVLVVLGEGPERTALERLAEELGVAESVFLPGRVGDVAAFYQRSELVIHPVRWEGFGLALLEAMLGGKPVIASAVSSAPEIVADGKTGELVPPDDPERLADGVSSLLGDPSRAEAWGRAGLERARAEFSVGRMADETIAVYEAALSK
jgi:glycosyltransferase involved in cell wall biosynthesis